MPLHSDEGEDDNFDDMDRFCAKELVLVQGAGLDVVNGVYAKIGTFENVGKYFMIGSWQGQDHEFSLFRCGTSNNTKHWYISIVPVGQQPGTCADIDFYSAPLSENNPDYPPSKGWITMNEGHHPAPLVAVWPIRATSTDVPHKLSTVAVLKPVAETYQKMLFSEKFSDIRFVCGDKVIVHAHRIVLAESSPYFDAGLSGPWKENENGEWKTSHPSHIIKTMLTLLYTGKLDYKLVDEDPLGFISIASEYDIYWLKSLAESSCIRSLDVCNVKDMWQAAQLYNSNVLKDECVAFVKKNALIVLANAEIINLRTEDPDSWEEFIKAICTLN